MYEKEVEKAQERLNAAMTLASKQPAEAINMILDTEKWVDETFPHDIAEYYGVIITYNEAMGDLSLRMRKFPEAEVYYKKMVATAQKLYELDKEKYDLRLAIAYCKLANDCATSISCHVIPQQPRLLNEKTQVPFDAAEKFYKIAITLVGDNCKKGSARHLETRARAINSLATLKASVGQLKESLQMFEDAVKILKAIYQAVDNVAIGNMLATTLQARSTVATLYNDVNIAQECVEDSIYVLKEHENEDPVRSGVLIARNYMNLAGFMIFQKCDQAEIDETYDKGTAKISMVNAISKNAAVSDEVSCYMLSGEYYYKTGRTEKGLKQVNHANELSKELVKQFPDNVQFANTQKHINKILEDAKSE